MIRIARLSRIQRSKAALLICLQQCETPVSHGKPLAQHLVFSHRGAEGAIIIGD
jgi:hypothetical protein